MCPPQGTIRQKYPGVDRVKEDRLTVLCANRVESVLGGNYKKV